MAHIHVGRTPQFIQKINRQLARFDEAHGRIQSSQQVIMAHEPLDLSAFEPMPRHRRPRKKSGSADISMFDRVKMLLTAFHSLQRGLTMSPRSPGEAESIAETFRDYSVVGSSRGSRNTAPKQYRLQGKCRNSGKETICSARASDASQVRF